MTFNPDIPSGVVLGAPTYSPTAPPGATITGLIGALPNIATLRALTGTPTYNDYYLAGYYSVADGGEGGFAFNAADTTSADDGGSIIVDASGNRWYRETMLWSIRHFGAVGDGVTNDTAAFTAAIAKAVPIYVPPTSVSYTTTAAPTANFWGPGLVKVSGTSTAVAAAPPPGSALAAAPLAIGAVNTSASTTSLAVTTASFTAPRDGVLVINARSVGNTTATLANITASLGAVTSLSQFIFSDFSFATASIPMTAGQSTTVTYTVTFGTAIQVTAGIDAVLIPTV